MSNSPSPSPLKAKIEAKAGKPTTSDGGPPIRRDSSEVKQPPENGASVAKKASLGAKPVEATAKESTSKVKLKDHPGGGAQVKAGLPRGGAQAAKETTTKAEPKKKKFAFKLGLKKKPKKPGRAVGLAGRFLVAGFLGIVFITGILIAKNKLEVLVGEIEQKRSQKIALEESDQALTMLAAGLVSVKEEVAVIEKAMPNEDELVNFLNLLEKVKDESGIEIESLSFSADLPSVDPQGHRYVELAVKANGAQEKLENFVKKLLELPILKRLKVASFDKVNEETSQLVLKLWLYVDPEYFVKKE